MRALVAMMGCRMCDGSLLWCQGQRTNRVLTQYPYLVQ